jgi:hypothetical protein
MRQHILLLSIVLFISWITPVDSFATQPFCACYFGSLNDCTQIPLSDGQKQISCETTCKNQYKDLVKTEYAESVSLSGAQDIACKTAHNATISILTEDTESVIPKPQIEIPTIKFSTPKRSSSLFEANFLGDYLEGAYKYLLSISGFIAIIMVLFGGLQYVFSAGAPNQMKKGSDRIKHAMIGLILLIGTYMILYTVNPRLVIFPSLSLLIPPRYELEDVIDDKIGDDPKGTGGGVIKGLIGELPSEYQACSKEAAKYTAQKLHDLKVCVGPCHCAYTASHFLRYIGCGTAYSGGAYRLPAILDQDGWVSEKITDQNRKNLKVGLAFIPGHVGVILGDDWSFDSGSTLGRVSKSCPKTFMETLGNPLPCSDCAKIPEEAPHTGRSGDPKLGGINGADGCKSNQGWSMRKGLRFWEIVVRPLKPGETDHPRVCCKVKSKWYVTKTLCEELKGTETGESKEACKNVKAKK